MTNFLSHLKKGLFAAAICFAAATAVASDNGNNAAQWISTPEERADSINTWIAFRRDFKLDKVPVTAKTRIAVDSKYWLWVNGKMAVFEGGVKRGPNPHDTYCDTLDLAPYLKKGTNKIALLMWYFGKNGFSHNSSGKSGLFFSMDAGGQRVVSDGEWLCRIHPAYGMASGEIPNYRLPESNICFDARKEMDGWQTAKKRGLKGFFRAKTMGGENSAPWNKLVARPIPYWKDFGVKDAAFTRKKGVEADTLVARLPYDMQFTPILTLTDKQGGNRIGILSNHTYTAGTDNIRAQYITEKGSQSYESLGWLSGEELWVVVPHGVEVERLAYRETGYDTEFAGTFECSSPFYNLFWNKALRTLYVNMRDTFFDCPERERAQWWGDAVLLIAEGFYTLSPSSHALMRKAVRELADWQKPNGVLHSPIPGNYNGELPAQMLASVSRYGFWNYYLNTGDRETLEHVYPAVKRYLSLWTTDSTGLTQLRSGDWLWGDWGDDKDMRLLMAGWHHIALDGAALMADELGLEADAAAYRATMERVKEGFNRCWTGTCYRHPSYKGATDDRAQAVAILSGIAESDKYEGLKATLRKEFHASPYMEKYVMEALCKMGDGVYALERCHERFEYMVNYPGFTTLFEGWGIGKEGFGGGTTNHAWSGGAQIVLAQYILGVRPVEPGYRKFVISPQPSGIKSAKITFPTVKGTVGCGYEDTDAAFTVTVDVPDGTVAELRMPYGSATYVLAAGKHTVVQKK